VRHRDEAKVKGASPATPDIGDCEGAAQNGELAWIRASEVGQYVYCRRAWWLHRVQGCQSSHASLLDAGQEFHSRHGWYVATARRYQHVGYVLLGIGCLVGIGVLWLVLGPGW
jgi:hypothetical protein